MFHLFSLSISVDMYFHFLFVRLFIQKQNGYYEKYQQVEQTSILQQMNFILEIGTHCTLYTRYSYTSSFLILIFIINFYNSSPFKNFSYVQFPLSSLDQNGLVHLD